MKKFLLSLALSLFLWFWYTFAQVDHFIMQIKPNPVQVNEAADMIIKAVDVDWSVVADYEWDVVMEVSWLWEEDYLLPDDGIYTFEASDQWEKTFSKWLLFKKEWEYELSLYDIIDDNIKTQETITVVKGWEATQQTADIQISSPIAGSIEKSDLVNVIWNSSFPNSPLEIYLDDKKVQDAITDENWDFSSSLVELTQWQHNLKVKILDVDNNVKWESDEIIFTYQTQQEEMYKSIEITPSNTVMVWDKLFIRVNTSISVGSAQLTLSGLNTFPMDKIEAWVFSKELTMNAVWVFDISVNLLADANSKQYDNLGTVNVVWWQKSVNEVKYFQDQTDKTKMNLEWSFSWDIVSFRVDYGTWENAMNLNVLTTWNTTVLENIDYAQTYFLKVFPLNTLWEVDWTESQLIVIEWNLKAAAPVCEVKWIRISTIEKDWKYYLVWDSVQWATKYIIYKSENDAWGVNDMQKVWETTETQFEYPFDANAKKDIYNYYAVEAECNDWVRAQIDAVKKVKVWPMDTIITMIFLAIIIYLGYTLLGYTKE